MRDQSRPDPDILAVVPLSGFVAPRAVLCLDPGFGAGAGVHLPGLIEGSPSALVMRRRTVSRIFRDGKWFFWENQFDTDAR